MRKLRNMESTAAAAAAHGLACEIILEERTGSKATDYVGNGNVLLDRLFGATLRTVPGGTDMVAELEKTADVVRARGGRGAAGGGRRGHASQGIRPHCGTHGDRHGAHDGDLSAQSTEDPKRHRGTVLLPVHRRPEEDRKSTRLNSSHVVTS